MALHVHNWRWVPTRVGIPVAVAAAALIYMFSGGKEPQRGIYPEDTGFELREYQVNDIDHVSFTAPGINRRVSKYLMVELENEGYRTNVHIPPYGKTYDEMNGLGRELKAKGKLTVENYPLKVEDREGNVHLLLPDNRISFRKTESIR